MDEPEALGSAGMPCWARWVHARARAAAPTRPRPRWDRSSSPVYRPPTSIAAQDPARAGCTDPQFDGRPVVVDTAMRPPETQKSWRRPIFPKGCPLSIFGAGELNFRVRDGNGCGLSARVTRILSVWTFRQRHSARLLVAGRRCDLEEPRTYESSCACRRGPSRASD